MLSEKQLEANRANAQKSTGPKTDAGKQRSSLNATRHGLTGQVVVLPEEDMAAFNLFAGAIVTSFTPFDAKERQLAQSYASFQWRINRAASIEDSIFTLGIIEEVAENLNLQHAEVHNAASNAKTFRSSSNVFDRLSIYNQRLVNGAAKVLKELEHMQAERRQRQEKEMAEAARLYNFHQMQQTPFDPKQNGFELTLTQIEVHVGRTILHQQSKNAETVGYNLPLYTQKYGKAAA